MKKLLLTLCVLFSFVLANAQCTTTNATSCQCAIAAQTNCDLLPDITISWYAILNYMGGPNEYPQVCTPACSGNDGRLRLTGSTPNIGFGPLTVRGSSMFVCGTDTFPSNPGTCPDGSTPKQLIMQRIYHKNGSTMTYTDRPAGAMTYHATHGHNHVDDWGVFTLRIQTSDPDPRNWPIVGSGAKLGFCLMDYYQCGDAAATNMCKDTNTTYLQGTTLTNPDFPNFGLGGGSYSCSVVEQGISSGYTDVYSESLDLMWINIPPGTCNGQYWIVIEVDPNNNFLEADETNNYTAVPFTLTQQSPSGSPVASITTNRPSPKICPGENITLTANAASTYTWSTGATTQSIIVNTPGNYSVTMTNYCGTASTNIDVMSVPAPSSPTAVGDTVCNPGSATLTATGSGNLIWRDGSGNTVGTGTTFTTPTLTSSTTYYVSASQNYTDTSNVGPVDATFGVGAQSNLTTSYEIFSTYSTCKIVSVKVNAGATGSCTIVLKDSTGATFQTATVSVPAGYSRVTLNWTVPVGNAWRLCKTSSNNLYRNNSNATNYPYVLNGVLSITGSSAGPAYYYFFYDWEVETNNLSCESPAVAVLAQVDPCSGITPGKDLNGAINVFPNPSNGTFNLELSLPGTANVVKIQMQDMIGRTVYSEQITGVAGAFKKQLNVSSLGKGVYLMNITIAGKSYFRKIVIQ